MTTRATLPRSPLAFTGRCKVRLHPLTYLFPSPTLLPLPLFFTTSESASTARVALEIDFGSTIVIMGSLLHNSAKYGMPGKNTGPCPKSNAVDTITAADGFGMIAPGGMYRIDELRPGRREPSFPNLHNLHDDVFARTLNPSMAFPADRPELGHRAAVWDVAAVATREALKKIPANSHINICANSGPYNGKLESLPPWTTVRGAAIGLLFVAEFRDDTHEQVHPAWRQIATPITPSEGRLLAGLRLLPAIVGRTDLTFTITNLTNPTIKPEHMNLVRDAPQLKYGCVANSWKATNLGCFYHVGGLYADEYNIFRASFA